MNEYDESLAYCEQQRGRICIFRIERKSRMSEREVHECDDFTTTYNFRAIFRVEKEV